jgi:SAM-dependent methyltransferase
MTLSDQVRMTLLRPEHDAFGRSLLDHQAGRAGPILLLEADDATSRPADLQPADFFLPEDAWPLWERELVARATGRVLDLGSGAGRHALQLQGRGLDVTAVDISPGAVEVCGARGVSDVRQHDICTDLPGGTWDTVLLMCGNLGLGGDWDPTRHLLGRLAGLVPVGGRLIGDSVDPTSDDPDDLAYEARNQRNGYHRGHARLRLRYRDLVTPWWDQLNIPVDEVEMLLAGTGWTLEDRVDADDGYAVVLRRTP